MQDGNVKSCTYSVYSEKRFAIATLPYCKQTHAYAHYNYLHILPDVQYKFKPLKNVYICRVALYR